MDDLETRVREELRNAVDHVEVSSDLWDRIRRRHRREPRKRMLEVATSLAVLAVVAAIAFPVVRALMSEEDRAPAEDFTGEVEVATDPKLLLDRNDLYSGMGAAGPAFVLASGEIDGQRWMFTAFENNAGGLSYGFPQPEADMAGGGFTGISSRNPLTATVGSPEISLGVGRGVNVPSFVFGPVVKEATHVRFELPHGEVAELPVIGQDAGFEVNFVVLPVSADVSVNGTRATALDAEGREVASTVVADEAGVSDDNPLDLEPATGPVYELLSGEVNGMSWLFVAYEWQDGLCYGFVPDRDTGGGARCKGDNPLELPTGEAAPVAMSTGSDADEGSFVFGPVRKDAALVRIELPSGEVHEVEPLGQRAGLTVNFYAQAYLVGTNVDNPQVTAYDAAGNRLG